MFPDTSPAPKTILVKQWVFNKYLLINNSCPQGTHILVGRIEMNRVKYVNKGRQISDIVSPLLFCLSLMLHIFIAMCGKTCVCASSLTFKCFEIENYPLIIFIAFLIMEL